MPKRDASPRRKPIANRLASLQLSPEVMQTAAGVLLVIGDRVIDISMAERGLCRIETTDRTFLLGHNQLICDGVTLSASNKTEFSTMFQQFLHSPPLLIILSDGPNTVSIKVLEIYSREELAMLRSWTKLDSVHEELYGSGSEEAVPQNSAAKALLTRIRRMIGEKHVYETGGPAILLNIRV